MAEAFYTTNRKGVIRGLHIQWVKRPLEVIVGVMDFKYYSFEEGIQATLEWLKNTILKIVKVDAFSKLIWQILILNQISVTSVKT